MKDKKFLVLCILAGVWLLVFVGLLAGVRLTNPKVEELISFVVLAWFAYWTFSLVRNKPSKIEKDASKEEKSKSE